MVLRGRDRSTDLLRELYRLLVHANDRDPVVIRFFVDSENLFHTSDELGVGFRRDHPVLDLSTRQTVFLSVVRTVS
jgi:hypothetical protein